jgi:hypothetical protein
VVGLEYDARGLGLRALVLTDAELRFTQRSDEGRQALAEAVAQAVAYESSVRRIWT